MTQGDLSFGDDVLGDASSPHRTGFEGKTPENRPVNDVTEDGDGDGDSFRENR